MACWHNLQVIRLRDEDPLEEQLRALLLLPRQSPDPEPAVWENGDIRFLDPEESREERSRWIEEDFRADVARWGARFLRPFGSGGWAAAFLQITSSPIRDLHKKYLLARTPYLVFVPGDQSEEWVLEGDLLFEGGSMPMIFLAADGLAEHVEAESGGSSEYLFCEENDLLFEDRWIILPGKTVSEDAVRGSLRSWYKEIWKSNRRHSSHQGALPRIAVVPRSS